MTYKVKWTKKALDDYKEIIIYLQDKWGMASAEKFKELVDRKLQIISTFPKISSLIGYLINIRKAVIVKQVSLYYMELEKEREVQVIRLLDNRQNPESIQELLSEYE